jgi:hypothetical protein
MKILLKEMESYFLPASPSRYFSSAAMMRMMMIQMAICMAYPGS